MFALVALALRLWQLDGQPLWLDEALTAHIAHAPDGLDFVHNTPPLYHWLMRGWCDWFGVGAAGLRSPSALAGAAFVWLSFHTARAVFGPRAAFATATLVLCSPLHLYYSQEARAYSLLLCELMLALWMLWRLGERRSLGTWLALVAASTAALHTHYLSAIPLALAYGGIGLWGPAASRGPSAKASLAAGSTACLLLVPWLLWWRGHTPFEPSDMQWLELLWSGTSGPAAVGHSLELFLLAAQAGRAPVFLKQFTSMPFADWLRIAALVAAGLLLGLGLWRTHHTPQRRAMWQCLLLALGPLLCLWAISVVRPVYCPGRYDLIAFPGFVLLLGQSIAAATRGPGRALRGLALVATGVLAFAVAGKDWRYLTAAPAPDPAPEVADHLRTNVPDGDTVILCGTVGLPVLAQLYRHDFVWIDGQCRSAGLRRFRCRLLPPSLEAAPAAVSRYLRTLEDGSLVAELQQMVAPITAPGIWLVLGPELHGDDRDPAMQQLGLGLFEVLHDAGYEFAGGVPELGIAHLTHRR